MSEYNYGDYSLVIPNLSHKVEYCRVMDKWETYNEKIQPPSMRRYGDKNKFSFLKWLADCEDDRTTGSMLANNIPCTLYFFVNESHEILGGVDYNHANTFRGQLHIGIVPLCRNNGYGSKMLNIALKMCKNRGLENIQVAPRKDNQGAIQTILRNGGVLLEEFNDGDVECLRYLFIL